MVKTYVVEEILDKKMDNKGIFYYVKWVGYPKSASTWEPIDNLKNVISMVNDYEVKHSNAPKISKKTLGKTTKKYLYYKLNLGMNQLILPLLK